MQVKIEKPAISARFIREASNLEVKFNLKRGFNNYDFERLLYFAVLVIMARKSKNNEKNCDFAQL